MDINKLIEEIIKNKIPCLFVAPHLDDAVLSAGGLLLRLAHKTKVQIATVFTETDSHPYTLSAKVYLRRCGYKDYKDLYDARRKEDMDACRDLNIKYLHLGFVDASFRKKSKKSIASKILGSIIPELIHIYPIYRINIISGKISNNDKNILLNIENKLNILRKDMGNCICFCPAGIGKHVDHIIVRNICEKTFLQTILWEDFPYSLKNKIIETNNNMFDLGLLNISDLNKEKIKIMSYYKSQIKSMFPKGIPSVPEKFYTSKNNIERIIKK